MTQLGDSLDAIRNGVKEALRRRPDLLITVGGLGPTHDDMTLKGLALSIDKQLRVNRQALNMIQQRYRNMEEPTRLTSYRRKMATLPEGAEPVPNPAGTAPGVLVKSGRTTILSLPGVPAEMKAIFKGSIIPILGRSASGPPREEYVLLSGIIESALAPALDSAQQRFPGLYFKSHPRGGETGVRPLIKLHIYSTDQTSGGKIAHAMAYLLKNLSKKATGSPRTLSRSSS